MTHRPPPTRTVVIVSVSPSWHVIECAKPCMPPGPCMEGVRGAGQPGCYLGSGSTPESASAFAKRLGYIVLEKHA